LGLKTLDFGIDDNNDWYDTMSDNTNHSEFVDALLANFAGCTTKVEVSFANTWFDTVTWDLNARVQLEEVTIVCSNHAYGLHHFENNDFDTILLVKNTKLVDITGPVTEDDDAHSNQDMSNTKPDTDDDDNAGAGGCIF
jgi:hypothetical protein